MTMTNMTELEIAHYSCDNLLPCEYAVACSFLECNDDSYDTECGLCANETYSELRTEFHDTHCRPYIKDQCIGSNLSFAYQYECEGGVLSEYYKATCDDAGFVIQTTGADDSTCLDENDDGLYAYYTVDCDPFVVEPGIVYMIHSISTLLTPYIYNDTQSVIMWVQQLIHILLGLVKVI